MKECKSLKDYVVKPGEKSPFANLLVDLAFKKAFDPDKPASRNNLINLLNDLLEPQLKRPIQNVWTRNVGKNLSGSKASRTAIMAPTTRRTSCTRMSKGTSTLSISPCLSLHILTDGRSFVSQILHLLLSHRIFI